MHGSSRRARLGVARTTLETIAWQPFALTPDSPRNAGLKIIFPGSGKELTGGPAADNSVNAAVRPPDNDFPMRINVDEQNLFENRVYRCENVLESHSLSPPPAQTVLARPKYAVYVAHWRDSLTG